MNTLVKSTPPMNTPMMGVMTSLTRLVTIAPNAAPMITPTARSITLPRAMNALNSSTQDGTGGSAMVAPPFGFADGRLTGMGWAVQLAVWVGLYQGAPDFGAGTTISQSSQRTQRSRR